MEIYDNKCCDRASFGVSIKLVSTTNVPPRSITFVVTCMAIRHEIIFGQNRRKPEIENTPNKQPKIRKASPFSRKKQFYLMPIAIWYISYVIWTNYSIKPIKFRWLKTFQDTSRELFKKPGILDHILYPLSTRCLAFLGVTFQTFLDSS